MKLSSSGHGSNYQQQQSQNPGSIDDNNYDGWVSLITDGAKRAFGAIKSVLGGDLKK